jgi:hypothetical protein
MLRCIPPTELYDWWPSAALALAPAIAMTEGAQTLETVRRSIAEGDAHLWVINSGAGAKAALVTYVYRCPSGQRQLRSSLAGGHGLADMAAAMPAIEEWARREGLAKSEIIGRKGWGRALEGYREVARVFVKDL